MIAPPGAQASLRASARRVGQRRRRKLLEGFRRCVRLLLLLFACGACIVVVSSGHCWSGRFRPATPLVCHAVPSRVCRDRAAPRARARRCGGRAVDAGVGPGVPQRFEVGIGRRFALGAASGGRAVVRGRV